MAWTLKVRTHQPPGSSRSPQRSSRSPSDLGSGSRLSALLFLLFSLDGTLPVPRRRKAHAFGGGGDHQSCLKPLTEDDSNDGNESDGDAGTEHPLLLEHLWHGRVLLTVLM